MCYSVSPEIFISVDRDRAADVAAILGEAADDRAMYLTAVVRSEEEVIRRPDAFGWFNLGSSLVAMGDGSGAADAFDRARALGLPWRMLWYQMGPFEAYAAVGRWDDVRALAAARWVEQQLELEI